MAEERGPYFMRLEAWKLDHFINTKIFDKFTGRVGVTERAIATGVELSIRNNVLLLSSMRYKAKEWEKSPGRSESMESGSQRDEVEKNALRFHDESCPSFESEPEMHGEREM